ncbi:hypothetical protein AQF98_10375 [Pedobacter sp. Hv1]|nr:hypothetical protein AQF98_10375 [Pedobacter sp. Hv1]
MKTLGIVGLGAAIIIDKKITWSKGYGYADEIQKKPFTANTIMNIASISKTFTGVCLMRAVEMGQVSLDEDINTYLPFKVINPNFPNEKITLRQLATHTSSLADRSPFYADSTYFYGDSKPEDLGKFLKDYFVVGGKYYSEANFLTSKPGTFRAYSNIAAGLAGYIVELRTGEKLAEYAKKYIFGPLKMINSSWSLATTNVKQHTKLYSKTGNNVKVIPLYEGTTYPDGGVRTSVNDLAKFFISLLNDGAYQDARILKAATVKEMLQFQFTALNKPENVRLDNLNSGIFWATKMGATRIGHNGSDPGVRTFMLTDLNKEIGVILFSNTSLSESEELKFFDIYDELYQYGQYLKRIAKPIYPSN